MPTSPNNDDSILKVHRFKDENNLKSLKDEFCNMK